MSAIEKVRQDFLTKEELAVTLKVSLSTINRWTKSDILKGFKVGKQVRYDKAVVEEFRRESAKN